MTGIAVRNAFQVILMLRLGFPEIADGLNFCHDARRPKARGVDVRNRVFRAGFLHVIDIINRRAITETTIVPLPI